MPVTKFEDLEVWQEALQLSIQLYHELKDCRDFSLRDQMQRSSVSIASNIAEGFDRRTNKEFIQHLYIAKGSCSELRTQLYLVKEIGTISADAATRLLERTRKISAMLYKLIKTRSERF
jgi:four helix bundle protein